jgi:hypothetical protein
MVKCLKHLPLGLDLGQPLAQVVGGDRVDGLGTKQIWMRLR